MTTTETPRSQPEPPANPSGTRIEDAAAPHVDAGNVAAAFRGDPVVAAVKKASRHIMELLEGMEDQDGEPPYTSPSSLLRLLREIHVREDLPGDKCRGFLAFAHGVLAARGLLDIEAERERTRPIFHEAYRRIGAIPPASVDVMKGEMP